MHRLVENQDFLNKCKHRKNCKHAIKNATSDEIKTICECVKNILVGNVPIHPTSVTRLKPYKKQLHTLALKKVPLYKKRQILQSGGGFFLPIIATLASSLISKLINNGS